MRSELGSVTVKLHVLGKAARKLISVYTSVF